jgi:hypothetical protein
MPIIKPEKPKYHEVEKVEGKRRPLVNREESFERVRELEDELFVETASVVTDSLKFADITFDETGEVESYPAKWDKEMGPADLQRRLRIAKANWMSSSEVPNGIKMAQNIAIGIMKARSQEVSNKPTIRIQNAVMTTPVPMKDIEVIEVEE